VRYRQRSSVSSHVDLLSNIRAPKSQKIMNHKFL